MDIAIRAATRASDAAAIARVHLASWQSAYRGILPPRYLDAMNVPDLSERWQQHADVGRARPDQSQAWVVEEDDDVVGFSLLGPCWDEPLAGFSGEVHMLYIHPARTRRGLGRELLSHSLEVLAQRGYFWSVIWVLEENLGARAFYEHAGLRDDGERRWERVGNKLVASMRYAIPLNPVIDFAALTQRAPSRV